MTMYQKLQELARRSRPVPQPGTFDENGRANMGRSTTVPAALAGNGGPMRGNFGLPPQMPPKPDASAGPAPYVVPPEQRAQQELQQQLDQQEKRRPRGRAATLLTGSAGLLSTPNVSRRSLMGF